MLNRQNVSIEKSKNDKNKVYNYLFDRVDQFLTMVGAAMGYETTITAAFRDYYQLDSDQTFPFIIREPSEEIIKNFSAKDLKLRQASNAFITVLPEVFSQTNPEETFYNSSKQTLWEQQHSSDYRRSTFCFTDKGFKILLAQVNALEAKKNASKVSESQSSLFYSSSVDTDTKSNYIDYLDADERQELVLYQQRNNSL